MQWQKIKLGKLGTMKYGKMPQKQDLVEEGYPVFSGYRITGYSREYLFKEPQLIVVARGVGGTGDVKISPPYCYLTNLSIAIQTNDKLVDKYFLKYRLSMENLRGLDSGSAQSQITIGSLEQFETTLPPLPTQRKIAGIFSAYDDLIENNLKRIKMLDEKAFLRYKEIVTNNKLYKVKLRDIAVVNEDSLKANSALETILYVDIASVSTGSIDNKTLFESKEAPGRAKRILKHEDIIWSCVRPNRKSYCYIWKPEENLIASTGFAVLTAKQIPPTFLYQVVTSNDFVSYLENHAKGATYPAVTASDFEDADLLIPSPSYMNDYHNEMCGVFDLKSTLQKQNSKLREARDILLPKLMSGQIEV